MGCLHDGGVFPLTIPSRYKIKQNNTQGAFVTPFNEGGQLPLKFLKYY